MLPVVQRRSFLGLAGTGVLLALSGCVSAVKCRIDGNFDHLSLKAVPNYVTEYDQHVIVHYEDLSSSEQRVVDAAIEQGKIKRCHAFDGEPNGIMRLSDRIRQRWKTAGIESTVAIDHTYLEREGKYFGISLAMLDAVYVQSIPVECDDQGCRSVTPTRPSN